MHLTANLIDNGIKRVVLEDLVHRLLCVIDHLVCTQLLQVPTTHQQLGHSKVWNRSPDGSQTMALHNVLRHKKL